MMKKIEQDFKVDYSLNWGYSITIEELKRDIEELAMTIKKHSKF